MSYLAINKSRSTHFFDTTATYFDLHPTQILGTLQEDVAGWIATSMGPPRAGAVQQIHSVVVSSIFLVLSYLFIVSSPSPAQSKSSLAFECIAIVNWLYQVTRKVKEKNLRNRGSYPVDHLHEAKAHRCAFLAPRSCAERTPTHGQAKFLSARRVNHRRFLKRYEWCRHYMPPSTRWT